MKNTIEKNDTELKSDVLAELKYEPSVKVTDIGVLVNNGTVTLNGFSTSYSEKWAAVKATKRVAGVKAIADDIVVKLPDSYVRTDGDMASTAANLINWSTNIPNGIVSITVRDGWITMEGNVEWQYQRSAAENAVHFSAGVKGVTNLLMVKPKLESLDIEMSIKSAFERNAVLDAKRIHVETTKNKVVLRGKVRTYTERDEAERAAWAASGVSSVDNQLKVEWSPWGFSE